MSFNRVVIIIGASSGIWCWFSPLFIGYGHLINISSILGGMPCTTFRSMYSASKAALNSLTTNLRMGLQVDPHCKKNSCYNNFTWYGKNRFCNECDW